jgi:3-hydroxyisobutyrate dehydrogenase-like beta-hydroxyacid dehydrogenase
MNPTGIGLAGCGRMGLPMLRSMRDAGFETCGFDVRPSSEFGASEGFIGNDFNTFGNNLRILFTVVRDIPQTEELLFDTQQVFENSPELEILVLCSTLSPRYLEDLKTRVPQHITLIDAPMSGAVIAAEQGRLSFMLGGEPSTLDLLQPIFDAMGTSFHRMGGFGAGMQAKVLNNLLAASSTVMTRLVLDWADQQGLDQARLLGLIDKSSGQNWFASAFEEIEFARDGYTHDNTIGILKKDVLSALDAAPDLADTRLPELLVELIADLKPRPLEP